MGLMSQMSNNNRNDMYLPTGIGIVIVFLLYWITKRIETASVGNIKLYMVSICVFFFVLFAFCFANKGSLTKNYPILEKLAFLLIVLALPFFLSRYYVDLKNEKYIIYSIYPFAYAGIAIVLTIIIYFWFRNERIDRNNNLWSSKLISILFALIQAWLLCDFNPYVDALGGVFHIDAYVNSIMNVLGHEPMDVYSASIYGHYGLLYYLPVNLLHLCGFSYWNAITLSIGIAGFVYFLCQYWCFRQTIKSDVLFYLVVIASTVLSFTIFFDQYYQILPHRMLFQPIIVLVSVLAFRNPERKRYRYLMWLFSAMAAVWNTETGLVLIAATIATAIYLDARSERKYRGMNFIKNVGCGVLALLSGYFLVNAYNLLTGGRVIPFASYLYPIGAEEFLIADLQVSLLSPTHVWFFILALFLCILGLYVKDVISLELDERLFSAYLTAIIGVGIYVYYINRAVITNMTIVLFPMISLSGFLCENCWSNKERINKCLSLIGGAATCIILVSMAIASVMQVGQTIYNKKYVSQNTEYLDVFIDVAQKEIPSDAVGYGPFSTELFALLNRKPGIYISDWMDTAMKKENAVKIYNSAGINALENKLDQGKYNHIVVLSGPEMGFDNPANYLPDGQYEKISSVEFSIFVYDIYERKEQE